MLRPYQDKIITDTRGHFQKGIREVLINSPPASGKTHLTAHMIKETISRRKTAWFGVHRDELLRQTSKTLSSYGVTHGRNAMMDGVGLWSIPTLINRLDDVIPPSLCVLDEAHHCTAKTHSTLHEWLRSKNVYIIGLSGTPCAADGSGLGLWFKAMVSGPQVPDLIAQGYMSDFDYYAPDVPDWSDVPKRGGDYSREALDALMAGRGIMGNVLSHWIKRARGKRTIGFAPTIKSSKQYVEMFLAAGIRAAHLDGDTPPDERKVIAEAFARGEIEVLWNVDLFGEGFDLSSLSGSDATIDCVILARATMSLRLHKQQVARAMRRKADGSMAIILDHVANWTRHGFPDDVMEWRLDGKVTRKLGDDGKPFAITRCDNCDLVLRPREVCPECGAIKAVKDRPMVYMDGELKMIEKRAREVEKDKQKEHAEYLRKKRRTCKTIDELIEFAKEAGYANPEAWAYKWDDIRRRSRG